MQFSDKTRSKGFALLITVTLLAFLVLLLVSLASLTRVETQVASNNQQLAQARQNALMALNVALGELQKYAGPDQRTTAQSDMMNILPPLPVYTAPSSRWIGVYGSGAAADYSMSPSDISTAVTGASDTKSSQAKLLNWLVSGNESTDFNPAAHMGVTGNITTPPSTFKFSPTDAITGLTVNSAASDTNIKINNTDARLLVGSKTVGTATATVDFVAAPLVPINAVTPAMGTTAVPVGRYAWWVGDEGIKARLNLPMPTDADKIANSFVSSQRAAVELVDATHPSNGTTMGSSVMLGNVAPYNLSDPNLTKLVVPDQFPMLSAASATALRTAIKYRYHDLTLYSNSVLSDTYAGGLKKDLSVVLSTTPGAGSPLDTDFIFKPEPNAVASEVNEFGLPTWGQLRSFVQTTDTNGAATPGLTPVPPTMIKDNALSARPIGMKTGVAPILAYTALGFRYIAPMGDVDGNEIRLAIYPVVILWNPYTTDIKPSEYEVGIQRPHYSSIQLQGQEAPATPTTPLATWTIAHKLENRDLSYGRTSQTSDSYFRFIIDNSSGIPAGQSLVFTLKTSGGDYTPGNTAAAYKLVNDDFAPLNHVLLPQLTPALKIGTAPVPHQGGIYRVGVNRNDTRLPAGGTSGPTVAATYLPISTGGGQNDYHWAGNGSQQAYLGAVVGGSPLPFSASNGSPSPYGSAATNPSRQWYQLTSWLNQTSYNYAPYGNVVGFPSDASAQSLIPAGEQDAGKYRGLLQAEGTLQSGGTPAWRMHVKSTIPSGRWLALSNPRALMITNSSLTGSSNFTGSSYNTLNWPPINNVFGTGPVLASTIDGLYTVPAKANPTSATLFEFRSGTQPLLSIGQLQHANLGWLPAIPAYAIGNSVGSTAFDKRDVAIKDGSGNALPVLESAPQRVVQKNSVYNAYANTQLTASYDHSWLLNRALWDKYFVSTVPNKGTGTDADATAVLPTTTVPEVLPNPRHTRYNINPNDTAAVTAAKLRNADTAAAHLLLAGGFNINSTSEQAWRAILGSTNKLAHDPTGTAVGGPAHTGPVYSRFSKPITNDTSVIWQGYRKLTEPQIAQFAKNIVTEIRRRGPSVSLADFINRRLYDNGSFPVANDKRLKGTIQAALDFTTTGLGAINNSATSTAFTNLVGQDYEAHPNLYAYHAFSTGSAPADGSANPTAPYSSSATFAPQFLTQADVLSTIGSGLSARSDTFVIRTYGEVLDPVNSTATTPVITGRAWCEAVVQRLPDYVDSTMAPETQLSTAPASAAKTTNQNFGRKFKIISFRWLTSNDI